MVSRKKINQTKSNSKAAMDKKIRHREIERNRHNQQKLALDTLTSHVPSHPQVHETSIASVYRCARYILFLNQIDILCTTGQLKDLQETIYNIHQSVLANVDAIAESKTGETS